MPHFFAMKHKKIIKVLFTLLTLIGFVIVGWFAFMRPDWVLKAGTGTSLAGYFLIFLCVTPAGSIRFGAASQRLSWPQWFAAVAKAHLVLIIFTFTVFLGFFGGSPAFMQKVNFAQGLLTIESYTKSQWGIFPWGVYGLWGIAIAYIAYLKMWPPYLYALVKGVWPKRLEPMAKTFVEATQFGATTLGLTLVASAIILLFSYAFEKMLNASHFKLIPITFSFLSVFMIVFSIKATRVKMRHWYDRLTLNHLFTFSIISLIVLLVSGAFTSRWLIEHFPQIPPQPICHQCNAYFQNIPQDQRFAVLYWGWWLTWVPLGGSYLAKLAQGRTLRECVLGLYVFPLCMWLALRALRDTPLNLEPTHFAPLFIIAVLIILPFLAWWMLTRILKNTQNSEFMLSGYMAVPTHFKRNRLWVADASKVTGISKYGARVVLAIFATLFLHTTAGWYGLQIQVTAMAVMIIWAIYCCLFFLVMRFLKDKSG